MEVKKTNYVKLIVGLIIAGVGFIVALVAIILAITFSVINKKEEASEIKLGNDSIPTVKEIVGVRNISSFSSNKTAAKATTTIAYSDLNGEDEESIQEEDVLTYIDELILDGYVVFENFPETDAHFGTESMQIGTVSVEEGKLIVIDIVMDYDDSEVEITYTKASGTLENY